MKQLNIAVIGTGVMGANHLRVYSKMKGVKIAAVVDADFGRAQKAAQEYNCTAYQSIDPLLANEELDAASVVVPTKLHLQVAAPLIARGIPLLIEKPLTFSSSDAHKLLQLARHRNLLVMAGHVERFNPVVTAAKKFLTTDKLGKPVSFLFRRIGLLPSRVKDINVVQDIGVHDIDLLHYLSDKKPRLKCASAGSALISSRYDYCQMLFEAGDSSAVLECNWITPTRAREFHIVGDHGMLKADLFNQTLEFYPSIVTRDAERQELMMTPAKMQCIPVKKSEPLKLELEHFIQCVREKTQPAVSLEDAVFAVEIANEVTNSLMKRFAVKKMLRAVGIPDNLTNKLIKQD